MTLPRHFRGAVRIEPEDVPYSGFARNSVVREMVATRRAGQRRQHARVNPDHADIVGAAGEAFFADRFGLEPDMSRRPFGDDGIDFHTPIGTIDVKTALKPYFIFITPRMIEKTADIIVLASYRNVFGAHLVHLLGWTRTKTARQWPVKDFGYGPNYYFPAKELYPIHSLDSAILAREAFAIESPPDLFDL